MVIARSPTDDGLTVALPQIGDGEKTDCPAGAEREQKVLARIMQCTGRQQKRHDGKRRRQDGANGDGAEAPFAKPAVYLFSFLLPDLFLQRLLASLLRQTIGHIAAD